MATEESLNEFVNKYSIRYKSDINQYQKELMETLANVYPNPNKDEKEENWQLIMLGLAISHIQRRYVQDTSDFENMRVYKKDFDQYMTRHSKTKTEQTIVNYLIGVVCEEYGEIIKNNKLSDLQTHMLNQIYRNTLHWIKQFYQTVDEQYRLINTFSTDEYIKIADYRRKSVDDRLLDMAECKSAFVVFIKYLWKIILNICQDKVNDEKEIPTNLELFKIEHYMDLSIKNYVCLNFPEDKYVKHSIILSPAGVAFKGVKRKIVGRMVNISPKPGKWFFQNNNLVRGKNYYNYSTANVNENPTVADLGEDSFYIECMECIGVDDDDWNKRENCGRCIFSEECVKGEL